MVTRFQRLDQTRKKNRFFKLADVYCDRNRKFKKKITLYDDDDDDDGDDDDDDIISFSLIILVFP